MDIEQYDAIKVCFDHIRAEQRKLSKDRETFGKRVATITGYLREAMGILTESNRRAPNTEPKIEPEPLATGKAAFVPPLDVDWFHRWSTGTEDGYLVRRADHQRFTDAVRTSPGVTMIVVRDWTGPDGHGLGGGPISHVTLTFEN